MQQGSCQCQSLFLTIVGGYGILKGLGVVEGMAASGKVTFWFLSSWQYLFTLLLVMAVARAFLQDGDLILLDEPTSNLDILNEGIILKSLSEAKTGKTIVLVSHRSSTMSLADELYEMRNGRVS